MKIKNISLLSVLVSLCLVPGCKNTGTPSGQAEAIFHTGYEALAIENQKPNKDGLVSKPVIQDSTYTIYGYYTDESFENEFDFEKKINAPTDIYVKVLKGTGEATNPYIVESGLNLTSITHFGSEVNAYVEVTKDFEVVSKYTKDYESTIFSGTFIGNNYKVTLKSDVINNTGLFYKTSENAVIKDFKVEGNVEGSHASTGALVNTNHGTIENIVTYGTELHASNGFTNGVFLMTKYDSEDIELVIEDHGTVGKLDTLNKGGAGAISGTNYGTIKNCVNKMRVSATIGAGGMAGINYGLVENCFNQGAIGTTGNNSVNSSQIRDHAYDYSYIGGMAGVNYGTIKKSVNLNQIFVARLPWVYNDAPAGQSDFIDRIRVGGIAGANFGEYNEQEKTYSGGIIEECANYGRVMGDMQVGGIAGYSNSYIADCFSAGYVGGRSSIGAIVGWQPGDNKDDLVGTVTNCIGFSRVNEGSANSVVDADGNNYTVTKLTNATSGAPSNVADHFKIARFASNSVYHNNSGNINPIDPDTQENTSISSTATMATKAYNQVGFKNSVETGLWIYEDTNTVTGMIGINKSWQVFLNVRLAWQNKTITVVNGDNQTTINGIAGIDYINTILVEKEGKFTSDWDANLSGAIPGRGLPEVNAGAGQKVIWVTEKDNPNSIWDGLLTDNITVYPMIINN